MYMGELIRQVLVDLMKDDLIFIGVDRERLLERGSFFTRYASEIESDPVGDYTRARQALEELGEAKVNDLVVVPISFVSEHIETLEEIDIEYRELATEAGVVNFRRVRALDTYPPFIEGLADLVTTSLDGPEVSLDAAAALPTTVKLYPQERWEWGWNDSSEVWNGRLAMLGFSAFLLELISGHGPLHALGLL